MEIFMSAQQPMEFPRMMAVEEEVQSSEVNLTHPAHNIYRIFSNRGLL